MKKYSHDELIKIYKQHLLKNFPDDEYYMKTTYDFGPGKNGEIDLLRISFDGNVFKTRYIYEFKTKNSEGQRLKALRQLDRIKQNIPFDLDKWLLINYYIARPIGPYLVVDKYDNGELSNLEKMLLK